MAKKKVGKQTEKKNLGGRPLLNGRDWDEVVGKLERAWACGCPDTEACLFANISRSTLHDTIFTTDPKLKERRDELKDQPAMNARINIVESIEEKDLENSKWYLERKKKKEFSSRVEKVEKDEKIEDLDELIEKIRGEKINE